MKAKFFNSVSINVLDNALFHMFWFLLDAFIASMYIYFFVLQINVIVEAWKNTAADVVSKLRQRSINPRRLEEIKWRLNLQMAQSNKSKMKLPNAMFELQVNNEDSEVLV